MNLDTLTLAPDQTPKPETPIEQAANQLIDTITRIITTEHATRTHDTHEAETRATNAEREYTRLCHAHEELLTEHEATLKELDKFKTKYDATRIELLDIGASNAKDGTIPPAVDEPSPTPTLPTTGTEQP